MLGTTRALSAFIVPFLVVAFLVLYGLPEETRRLFAWTIMPPAAPMILGAVYIGGAYFFVRAFRAAEWHTVKVGFIPVTTFAFLLGVATVLHWDTFNHRHLAFWLWAGLYFTTPVLVLGTWLRNRKVEAPPESQALRLSPAARWIIGGTGVASVALGGFLFLGPEQAAEMWVWRDLKPLTSRVLGAIFCLGVAGLGIMADPRWRTARVMLQTEQIMLALILVAGARDRGNLDVTRPFTWLLSGGLAGVLVSSILYSAAMDRRAA